MARCAPSDEVCYIGSVFAPILLVLFASVCVARHFLGPMQGLFRILVFAQEIYALCDHQTVHTRASKRARRDDKSSALVSQTSTSAKSFGHQQPPSQQQLIPPVCYVNMCYVIVVLHIHCFLAHSVCGTVSGSRYSCPKQCICPVFTAIEATFGSAGNPAAGTTGVLHEYECATYIVCYVYCSLSHTVCGQSPVIDEHRGRSDDESAALESQTSTSAKSFGLCTNNRLHSSS